MVHCVSVSRRSSETLFLLDAQFGEFFANVGAMVAGFDFLVDEQNFAVLTDVVSPTVGHAAVVKASECLGYLFGGIAQNGVV